MTDLNSLSYSIKGLMYLVSVVDLVLVLTIFNEGAYLTFKSILLQLILVRLWTHARIRSWNQPVLSNKGKVSCSMIQRGPLMGLEHTTSTLRIRSATHCTTVHRVEYPLIRQNGDWTSIRSPTQFTPLLTK